MAILKQTVHVKSQGATGWDENDVLDALETVFTNLGMHGGTSLTGVPHLVRAPGNFTSSFTDNAYRAVNVSNFAHCGGHRITHYNNSSQGGSGNPLDRYFYVYNDSNNAYRVLEEYRFQKADVYDSSHGTRPNQIKIERHGLSNGDLRTYAATENTDPNDRRIGGLTPGIDYYVIKVDEDHIKLETSVGNGEISLSTPTTTGTSLFPYYFRQKNDASNNNNTIRVKQYDNNYFVKNISGISGTFNLVRDSDVYDSTKLVDAEYNDTRQATPTNMGDDSNITLWNTTGYPQTETEALFPDRGPGEGTGTNLDDYGIVKYIYANSDIANNPNMKGEIIVEPWAYYYSNYAPYWKYTVSGSAVDAAMGDNAGRTDLKLRVYRYAGPTATYRGDISNITIHSIAENWSNDDQFTIPGENVGGVASTNDIKFGVNQDESLTDEGDGTCSIRVDNFGSGSTFFSKNSNDDGTYAILKVVHDASKDFGTTFYTFGMHQYNKYQFTIQSGSTWRFINHGGTLFNISSTSENTLNRNFGMFGGVPGLDYQSSFNYIRRSEGGDSEYAVQGYAFTSNSTSYPLEIRTYRAQSPQDTDFAIIQFVQISNSEVVPCATFSISRGTQHGNDVYDLDHVYQDTITNFYSTSSPSRTIVFRYGGTHRDSGNQEPVDDNSVARGASYGYLRESDGSNYRYYVDTQFTSNIDTENVNNSEGIRFYYRNSTFDDVHTTGTEGKKYKSKKVSPLADYYKPISGLPISTALLPIPYYLPDDFVMLQVAATPGSTEFRTGDTVTINSGSEVYEIILASYSTNQTGLNNVTNGSSMGMLFMARTT